MLKSDRTNHRHARRHVVPSSLLMLLVAALPQLSCIKRQPASYLSSLDYQAQDTLRQSLFKEDTALLSNEEIERVLSSKIELPRDARLALLQLGVTYDVLVLPALQGDTGDGRAVLSERLASSKRLSSVALLPSLLIPSSLSVGKLREAAARFQADLLFVYRTPCQQFQRNRFFSADEAKAYCVAEGILLDVRTGIIPYSGTATSTFSAVRDPEDLTSYETLRRSEAQAIAKALDGLAEDFLAFLESAP